MLTVNYQYRLYPTGGQEILLLDWLEICRGAYNYALGEIKDWYNGRKCSIHACSLEREYILPPELRFPGEVQQLNALPRAKKAFPKLAQVPSQVLQQTIKQLHRGWEFFQARGFGFPRFKKFGQFKSLLFPQFKVNPITGGHIKLPKLGLVPINLHRPIPDGFIVKQVRILRRADCWYASLNLQCAVDVPQPMPHGHPIGVDVGLEKFLVTSDGFLVKPPRFFKRMQRQLKSLQRRLSRKQKRSKNYEKARIKVARMHHKIDNARKDFHFRIAHQLCNQGGMIFMEDLDYRLVAKGFLGKHSFDAGFDQFRDIVKYIAWKKGKYFDVVNANGTSQTCPKCGAHVPKDLCIRVHECPECGYATDRDVATSQVIRNRGLAQVPEGYRGMETACAVGLPRAKA